MITYPAGAIDERFNDTIYLVEASNDERHFLWKEFTKYDTPAYPALDWKDDSGLVLTVGELDSRPICVCFMWTKINGQRICWWEPTSQLVDHKMIDAWLDHHTNNKEAMHRIPQSNAANFHHVIHQVNLANGIKF